MKNFHQNLLIVLALGLCGLCAWQWYAQTHQREQVDYLNQLLSKDQADIQGYTNSIKNLDTQVAQMDAHITELEGTIKTNNQVIVDQKRQISRLELANESYTNQIIEYKRVTAEYQAKLQEAYDGVKKQNEAIKELVAQRDEFIQKLNDSVKDRNEVVTKYNDLVARVEKMQGNAKGGTN
jgi:chromosome segregation ATPase